MSTSRPTEFPDATWDAAWAAVLDGVDEDVYGLWEVLGAVNVALPRLAGDERLAVTQAVVAELLERGWFALCFGRALSGEAAEPVERARWDASLRDPASWDPFARSESDPYFTLEGTDAGIAAYRASSSDLSR